jgi:hypothetical protein
MSFGPELLVLSVAGIVAVGAQSGFEPCRIESYLNGNQQYSRFQARPNEKESRTPAQKKIDSQLLYALKQKRGVTRGVPTERIELELDQKGRALVDITAIVTPQVVAQILKLGGEKISDDARYHTIRASLALEKLEALAKLKDVRFIAPAAQAMNSKPNNNR